MRVLGLLLSLPKSFCETNSLWSLNLWEVWAALTPVRIFSAKHFPLDVAPGFHFLKTCRGVFSLLKSCVYITVPSKSAVIASWSHSSFLTPFSLFFLCVTMDLCYPAEQRCCLSTEPWVLLGVSWQGYSPSNDCGVCLCRKPWVTWMIMTRPVWSQRCWGFAILSSRNGEQQFLARYGWFHWSWLHI